MRASSPLQHQRDHHVIAVVFGSDQGLVGHFNDVVAGLIVSVNSFKRVEAVE